MGRASVRCIGPEHGGISRAEYGTGSATADTLLGFHLGVFLLVPAYKKKNQLYKKPRLLEKDQE